MTQFEGEALLEDFLREIQSLEDFRALYRQRYAFEGLGSDDQDVRRLMEAMAFYAARSRGVAERAVRRYKRQALERLFPYLLTPMPAMGLLHPRPISTHAGWLSVPEGGEFVATETDMRGELVASRVFATRAALQVVPLHIVRNSVRLQNKVANSSGASNRQRGWLLSLTISADPRAPSRFFTPEGQPPLDSFVLHINPHGEPLLSIRLFDALKCSVERLCLRVRAGDELRFSRDYGSGELRRAAQAGGPSWENPIEHIRRLIHFPIGELGFRIDVRGMPTQWERMDLEFHLSEEWPPGLSVHDDSFLINPVTVHNVTRALAEPIEHDGTHTRLRISHTDPETGLRVREVLGVYRSEPDVPGAREVLFPGSLLHGGYLVDVDGVGEERAAWLEIESDLGELARPQLLQVEADWYDPSARLPNPKVATVTPENQDAGAARWSLQEPLREPCDSPLRGNDKRLEELLDIHARGVPNVDDLRALLKALGTDSSDVFRRLPSYLVGLETETLPDTLSPRGAWTVFELSVAFIPPVLVPAMRLLVSFLPRLLSLWTGLPDVRVRATFTQQPELHPLSEAWREQ